MFKPPRGTRDFMPNEMRKIEYVIKTIRSVFEIYGYEPLETPAFESWSLLKAKCGGDIEGQIYKFKDKKGRELGLRFDFTVPLARIIASNPVLPKPFRRYQISRVWRYERPEARRRFREFWQADVDIVGSRKKECDVEAMAVASSCLEALGFKRFFILLNSRKILEGLAEAAGIPNTKHPSIFRIIDKLKRIGLDQVKRELMKELREVEEPEKKVEKILKYVGVKGGEEVVEGEEVKSFLRNTVGEEGLDELREIVKKARSFGVLDRIIIDLSLARGLDYYTGPIFEVVVEKHEDVGSVAGGGRYDELIGLYGGGHTPSTGISLGIDRLVRLMGKKGLFKLSKTNTKVFVAPVSDEMRDKAIEIAQKLRDKKIPAEVDVMGRKLTEQLKYVDKKGIPYSVIVGRKEVEDGFVMLRDMERKEQRKVRITEIFTSLKEAV